MNDLGLTFNQWLLCHKPGNSSAHLCHGKLHLMMSYYLKRLDFQKKKKVLKMYLKLERKAQEYSGVCISMDLDFSNHTS